MSIEHSMCRYTVNQPSSKKPLHEYHGMPVLGSITDHVGFIRVYFTKGTVISINMPREILSEGWPLQHL